MLLAIYCAAIPVHWVFSQGNQEENRGKQFGEA
jgi:hypothetical protein